MPTARPIWTALVVLAAALGVSLQAPDADAQTPDTTPPTFVSAETDTTGRFVTIKFSEDVVLHPLAQHFVEATSFDAHYFVRGALDITIDGRRELTEQWLEMSGDEVRLQVSPPYIASSQTVRVSYDNILANSLFAIGSGLFLDAAGNAALSFSDQAVTNNSTSTSADDPEDGPEFSLTELTLTEETSTTFTVTLPEDPGEEVTVSLYAFPPDALRVTTGALTQFGAAALTFDENDWNVAQTVTLAAPEDRDSFPAWGYVYGFIGESRPTYLRSVTSFFVLVPDADPLLTIVGANPAPYAENGTGAVGTYSAEEGGAGWSLSGPDKENLTITGDGFGNGRLSFKSPPDYERPADADTNNVYVVYLAAQMGSSTGFEILLVAVGDVAEAPVFTGTSTTREVPENSLAGTDVGAPVAAIDDAGDTPAYSLTGTDAASFDIVATTGQIRTKSGVDYDHETKSSYSVVVNVSDGLDADGNTETTATIDDSIAVTITVKDLNEPPAFPSTETGARSISENTAANRNVGAPVSATDEDNDSLTYTLTGGDADSFDIVSTSGQIRTKTGVTYDHEDTSTYVVTVNVSDGKDDAGESDDAVDDSITVTISLADVNEKPALSGPVNATFRENGTGVVASYAAEDPDLGDSISWSLTGSDQSFFTISNGALSFNAPPDREARNPVYRVTVVATDSEGLTDTRGLTVTVTDVNESPVVTGADPDPFTENTTGPVGTFTAEDPEGAAIIWSLRGGRAVEFNLTPSGALNRTATLTFKEPPDAETRFQYSLTIVASDGVTTEAELPITVTVQSVDEPGTIVLSELQPEVGTPITATLADDDTILSGPAWQWESGGIPLSGETANSYTPVEDDVGKRLRVTATYSDGFGEKTVRATSANPVQAAPTSNTAPAFEHVSYDRSVSENAAAGALVGAPVAATDADPEHDDSDLTYSLSGSGSDRFAIENGTGRIRVAPNADLNHEDQDSYTLTAEASDPSGATAFTTVNITVLDLNERPVAMGDRVTTNEDTPISINVLANDSDPDEDDTADTLAVSLQSRPRNGLATLNADKTVTYTPSANFHGADSLTYRISDGQYTSTATVTVEVREENDVPIFPMGPLARTVSSSAVAGTNVGVPVTASDVDDDPLEYSLSGGGGAFAIDQHTGQIKVTGDVTLDTESPYSVTVRTTDSRGGTATVDVTITVSAGASQQRSSQPPIVSVGIGGGGGPSPSEVDFEWTVDRDVEELDEANGSSTGIWSDGETLWILDNPDGAGDAVYAYDLETGERLEDREFELDGKNGAPRGVWSDGETLWVSDSGQEKLFAYGLETGERVEERDIALARRNRDARGIWSDGAVLWVADGGKNSLFAYELETGEFSAEYALDDANGDPRGVWSDGVTVWVADHGAKRLFAYRLPQPGEEPAQEVIALERVTDEEFAEPGRVGNNSPRGIWSDGAVMYVADANDDKVYSYNMPDAIDARLASLSLDGVDFGEFSTLRYDYASETIPHGNIATLTAIPAQEGATVKIEPPDQDGDLENGYQLRLVPGLEITITVTSADGSRERVYRLFLGDEESGPSASCLRGAVNVGFSLVVSEGGSVEDLVSCAERRHVTALYALHEGEYEPYIIGAPDFVNARFRALFPEGVPALLPLVAHSDGPATPAPAAPAVTEPFATCLRGEIGEGFSLVVSEGGNVADLVACAEGLGVTAVYALVEGEWVSYILGAPEFVNARFRGLFPDGVPAATPLTVRGGG